ncbi:MAG: SpoIIIAH-like family protein [Lachnospiraceae bacterium]
MKRIFKKNQVIITAMALMICAAGYLQFSNTAGKLPDSTQTDGDTLYFEVEGLDNYSDISDEDIDLMQQENAQAAANQKLPDGSDAASETSDGGKNIGEAILVSTTISGNFTTNAKLVREQRRAQSKETLMAIINNELISDEQKQSAVDSLVALTTIAEKENAAELLLEAKGFADPVVNIVENEVDVVINASSVTDQQVAQIEDIVTRKTGFEPENIKITAAIQED